jgi:hypothetical protein
VLRPPAASFASTPRLTSSLMSRLAVSWEHLASFAHLEDVSLPSNPSSSWLTILRWRSLKDSPAWDSQKRALRRTVPRVASAPSKARSKQAKNQCIQGVTSSVPFCVRSRIS